MNSKARHNLIDAKCRWRSDWLDGAGSFWEPLGQTKVMQIRQRGTQIRQRETTHEICCLAAQYQRNLSEISAEFQWSLSGISAESQTNLSRVSDEFQQNFRQIVVES